MSASLIEERRLANPKRSRPTRSGSKRIPISRTVVNTRERVEPIRRYSLPPATNDEELRFVEMAAIWMAVLAVTPLTLFYIITFFYPDIFMVPAAP